MNLVTLNIGSVAYAEFSLTRWRNYCQKYNHKFYVISPYDFLNHRKLQPSWNKLLVHKYFPNNSFFLFVDLDLLPVEDAKDIESELDQNVINMVEDCNVGWGKSIYPKFKYNAGLIGIPKRYSEALEELYEKSQTGRPSYEQYYLNDLIVDQKLEIKELKICWNRFCNKRGDSDKFIHYTGDKNLESSKDKLIRIMQDFPQ